MKLLLELADSEVGRVEKAGDGLHIHLSAAAVLQFDGASGEKRSGYARAVELVLFGVTDAAPTTEPMGRIAHGRLAVAERWSAQIALPLRVMAPIRLELRFAQHGEMTVAGNGVECRFTEGPNFTESLSC
jgi:hypothetical protein